MTAKSERHQYKAPPLEEALCEFRFEPSEEWDLTVIGKLQAKIEAEYPGKAKQQRVLEANVQVQDGEPSSVAMRNQLAKIQIPNAAGDRLVAVGPDVLSVHVLRPYPGWEDFRPRIETALKAYQKVAKPKGCNRVGLRYINRIVLEQATVDLDKMFNVGGKTPVGIPDSLASFIHRTEHVYDDGAKLILTFATAPAPKGHSAFILDLDAVWMGDALDFPETMKSVDAMRDKLRTAFEASISHNLREVFDG